MVLLLVSSSKLEIIQDIIRRWKESEIRIKETEDLLSHVKYDDRSLEEDRLEILGELLDKATQSFEIFEEHEVSDVQEELWPCHR